MWPSYREQVKRIDVTDLSIALERRRTMLASVAAWFWLTEDCAQKIMAFARRAEEGDELEDEQSDWRARLTQRVFKILMDPEGLDIDLRAGDFLPGLPRPECVATVRYRAFPGQTTLDRVCNHAISTLRVWLGFPTNTEWVAARFAMEVVNAFHNPDVLLLKGVWDVFKHVKARILDTSHMRASSMHPTLLQPFVEALRALPLAQIDSPEHNTLVQISAIINTASPRSTHAIGVMIQNIINLCPHSAYFASLCSDNRSSIRPSSLREDHLNSVCSGTQSPTPLLTYIASPTSFSPPTPEGFNCLDSMLLAIERPPTISAAIRSPSPAYAYVAGPLTSSNPSDLDRSLVVDPPIGDYPLTDDLRDGVREIVEFVGDLIPLAQGKRPLNARQRLVQEKLDFYLPFRELGPSRI